MSCLFSGIIDICALCSFLWNYYEILHYSWYKPCNIDTLFISMHLVSLDVENETVWGKDIHKYKLGFAISIGLNIVVALGTLIY